MRANIVQTQRTSKYCPEKKKPRAGLSDCDEQYQRDLDISNKEYQMRVRDKSACAVVRRVTLLVTVRVTPLLAWEKAGRVNFA